MLLRRTLLLLAVSLPAVVGLAQGNDHQVFAVVGKVRRPGRYELKDRMRVVDAIDRAGGLGDSADRNTITIVRKGKRYRFDYDAYLRGELEQNVLLENGDLVAVR
jgi:protein involved in polysaccharide export with SLBB domain